MRVTAWIIVGVGLVGLGSALAADATAPAPAAGRYDLTPAETGFIRLDTQTGATAHCAPREGVWYCDPLLPDGGMAARVDALAEQVARLTAALNALPTATGGDDRIAALAATVEALTANVATLTERVAVLSETQMGAAEESAVAESADQPEAETPDDNFVVEAMRRLMALAAALRGSGPTV